MQYISYTKNIKNSTFYKFRSIAVFTKLIVLPPYTFDFF